MVELATAAHPWPNIKELGQLFNKIVSGDIPEIPSDLSEDC